MSGSDGGKCCVCSAEDVLDVRFGGRIYCKNCLERVTANRNSKVRSLGLYELGALVLLVGLGAVVNELTGAGSGGFRLLFSLVFLSAVSLTFMILFYRQDTLEPEPKMLVAFVFLGGMALAALVHPLLDAVFRMKSWTGTGLLEGTLLYTLVYGMSVEYAKFLMIRYTIYMDREYDEIADGVVYGSVAGIGFATAVNLGYVFGTGGVDLLVGTVRMATLVLVHAAISGLVGYFLGRQKFVASGSAGPALSLLGGGMLWGGYYLITRIFSQSGMGYSPIKELSALAVYSLLITAGTLWLMHRGQKQLLALAGEGVQ